MLGTSIGGLLILAGVLISPAWLKKLGAMRIALESENEMVRTVAELEILAIRAAAITLGALCVVLTWQWRRLGVARPVRRLRAYRPVLPPPALGSGDFLNLSAMATAVALIGCGLLLVAGEARLGQERLRDLGAEDGPIEQATAYLFLLAAIVAFGVLLQTTARSRRIMPAWLILGFAICFAEEISWGQRVLGFETPAPIKRFNIQQETNFHNLFGYAADHAFVLGLFGFGVLLPLLAWQFPLVHRLCDRLGLPVPSLGLAVCFLAISALHSWTVYRLVPETPMRVAEVREFLAAFAILFLMIDHWSRLRRLEPVAAPAALRRRLP